jgi:gliding motility-associated protein GldM
VNIRYFNQVTGKEESINYEVKYTVGSANTSIALPEMNVLYIGWDNKVQIAASGAGDDKVVATISGGGGTLTKMGGGNYIAKVSSVTDEAIINVTVDGKQMGSQSFRVRTIPDPVATVGGVMSNDNIPAGQFKAQSGVGAFIKDFPLKLQYTVVSFTLTADDENGDIQEAPCTGNTWSPKALSIIRGLTAGRTVTIDNIRAQGPDGRVRKIPGLVYYIK